jgi:hypothetical protein
LDGRTLDCFEVGHPAYSLAVTPEPYKGKKFASSPLAITSTGSSLSMGKSDLSVSRSSRRNNGHSSLIPTSISSSIEMKEELNDWRFASLVMIGGNCLSRYRPDNRIIEKQDVLKGIKDWSHTSACTANNSNAASIGPSPPMTPTPMNVVMESCSSTPTNRSHNTSCLSCSSSVTFPILQNSSRAPRHFTRLKYTSSGGILYAATNTGIVKRFRRYPDGEHVFLGDVMEHEGPVYDMDVSPYDEYVVTASKDKHVGLLCLGSPNHGCTGRFELT